MMTLLLKTNIIPLTSLSEEISGISHNLQVEKRKNGIRLQLAQCY